MRAPAEKDRRCRPLSHAFKALAAKGINIRAITTSEIKFSMPIDEPYTELAVRTLHTLYGLHARQARQGRTRSLNPDM